MDGLELGADEASFVTLAWPKMKDVYKAPESEPIGAPPTEDVPPAADDDDDDDDADFDEVQTEVVLLVVSLHFFLKG